MSLALFNNLAIGSIKVLVDCDNQPWFKCAHVGKFLDIKHIVTSLEGLDKREMCSRTEIELDLHSTGVRFKGQATDTFLSVYGVFHVIIKSRKPRGKELRRWIMTDIILRGLQSKMDDVTSKHNAKINALKKWIEAIPLESEEERQRHEEEINTLKNEHQEQVQDLVQNRNILRAGSIDTLLQFVQENEQQESRTSRFRYFVIRCQQRALKNRLNLLRNRYPNMRLLQPECDDANALH